MSSRLTLLLVPAGYLWVFPISPSVLCVTSSALAQQEAIVLLKSAVKASVRRCGAKEDEGLTFTQHQSGDES